MKKLLLSFIGILISVNICAQETGGPYTTNTTLLKHLTENEDGIDLPFFDDFEETIGAEGIFEKWTAENIEGWHYWHIVPGQHMRFVNTDLAQNDWLITKQIVGSNIENILINFDVLYGVPGVKPKLVYTNEYNGNVSESSWTEINYSLGENENEWHNTGDIIIETPGDTLYFAFQYEAEANTGIYILLDNFKVQSYVPLVVEKVSESEHFEFYTNIADQEDFYTDYIDTLEYKYKMYKSIWERPSSNTIFPEVDKIKVIYVKRSEIPNFDLTSNNWDCGTFDFQNGEIFISPLDNEEKTGYYGTLGNLMCNELAQMALHGWLDYDLSYWLSEGFGLYEMGYRPNRQQLLDKLSELGTDEPPISSLENIDDLPIAGKKDLMVSFIQSKDIVHCYFYGFWGDNTYKWWQLLKHYYIKEVDRIELIYSTDHFDYYGAEKEIPYVEPMAVNMENQFDLQVSRFGQIMQHRVNICIYDNEVGKEINNRTDFQGLACGSTMINTSHLEIGHYGLLNHEFMHIWVNLLSTFSFDFIIYPGQFLNEGLAESTDSFMTDEEIPWHYYKIEALYYHYQRKYNRNPTFLEIVDNAEVDEEDGFWVDAYALGELYWRYMNDKYPTDFWMNVKEFLQNDRDWSVFGGKTTEQEGAEFIYYLKSLVNYIPPDSLMDIPFEDPFNNFENGWTKPSYNNPDNWQIDDGGLDGGNCARFYTSSDKNEPIESWLISPPLNAENMEQIKLSFDFARYGEGIELEVFYTNSFKGYTDSTNWTSVKEITMPTNWGWSNSGEITISNPPDTLFIGLRKKSTGEQHLQLYIDNFEVKEVLPLETLDATDINHNSSTLNATATSDFYTTVTQRGFYWSQTNSLPTANDNVEIVAGITEEYSFELTGLSPETIYYFRAFATNSDGTVLGEVEQFATLSDLEYVDLPFFDDFENEYENWSSSNITGADAWHISGDDGIDLSKCARFYITWNPQQANDDWLFTPLFNTNGISNLQISFKYSYHGDGIIPEFYYANSFDGNLSNSTWTQIDNSFWQNMFSWNDALIEIENPGNPFVFAIRYQSTVDIDYYILIDDFGVEGSATNTLESDLSVNDFKIYPNPITKESILSFSTQTTEKVEIAIYDIQGRKQFTILDKKLNQGLHSIPLSEYPFSTGVYFVRLSMQGNITTLRMIVTDF